MASLALGVRFSPSAGGTADFLYSGAVQGYRAATVLTDTKIYRYRAESADLSEWEYGYGAWNSGSNTLARTTVSYSSTGSKINFTAAPQVAIMPFVDDILQFDDSMSLTSAQQLMGRTNLGFASDVGKIEWWPTSTLQAGRLKANGASLSRTTYPILLAALVRSGTATFTNGSQNVGMATHALSVGDPIKLFTAGTLPTNFTAGTHGLATVGTNYFVHTVVDANTVKLTATMGGSAITAGSAGSGAHTWVNAPHGDGDGSTTFTAPNLNGTFARAWDDSAGVDANRAIGDVQLDAFQGHIHSATTTAVIGSNGGILGVTAGGTATFFYNNAAGAVTIGNPTSDGSNGTPRTAAETRPRNISLLATVKYSA